MPERNTELDQHEQSDPRRWNMDAQIKWVLDLGRPSEAGTYRFRGKAVFVRADDIKRADTESARGSTEVTFNATYFEPLSGEPYFLLSNIA